MRILFLLSLWTTFTAALCGQSKQQSPNILFIHVDDLGYHDLSHTGSAIYQTPNIDRLAEKGLSFRQAYASYPRCTPSRYALMTGNYPVNEDYGHLAGIPAEQQYWQVLKKHGYTTSFVGKWHLGTGENTPRALGFDHSFAAGAAGGVDSRFYPFNGPDTKPKKYVEDVTEAGKKGDYLSDLMTTETMRFMKANRERPFFAMLSFYAVHTPLEAKPADRARNAKEIAAHDYGDTPEYIKEGTGRRKMRQDDPDYAGMVENIDENVGRLLDMLDQLDLEDNTIVVFSSDHGGLSNDGDKRERHLATTNYPLRAGKGHMYEGGIRVPLIVYWDDHVEKKVDEQNIVLGMDVMPTLVELATGTRMPGIDGRSYLPVLEGKEDWSDRTVFWHANKARPYSTGDSKVSVIRKGNYKLLNFKEGEPELYDLSKDISEQNNLAAAEPDRVKAMQRELKAWKAEYLTEERMKMKKRARDAAKGKR